MSRMATDFFAQSPVLAFPVLALLIFCCVFVLVVLKTARTAKPEIDARAKLPLSEDLDV
jgi:hypothetical protein